MNEIPKHKDKVLSEIIKTNIFQTKIILLV
jgi:hypothetical protein